MDGGDVILYDDHDVLWHYGGPWMEDVDLHVCTSFGAFMIHTAVP